MVERPPGIFSSAPLLAKPTSKVHYPTRIGTQSHSLTAGNAASKPSKWGLGFTPQDFDKPQIGIGTSLLSRNLIAKGTELVCTSHCYDAIIGLQNCDKNGPGFAMALARTNYPGLIVNGGSIMPGCHKGKPTTILDVYDVAARAASNRGVRVQLCIVSLDQQSTGQRSFLTSSASSSAGPRHRGLRPTIGGRTVPPDAEDSARVSSIQLRTEWLLVQVRLHERPRK